MDSGLKWEVDQKREFVDLIEHLRILDLKLYIFLIFVPYHVHVTPIILNLSLKVYVFLFVQQIYRSLTDYLADLFLWLDLYAITQLHIVNGYSVLNVYFL